jgi:hypothetical protein
MACVLSRVPRRTQIKITLDLKSWMQQQKHRLTAPIITNTADAKKGTPRQGGWQVGWAS